MAVLKQTSPTAWPSAPRPKPSSTVPSASTRSAVGLWSGQAEAFSDVVISALHSPRAPRRQSRKPQIHMRFRVTSSVGNEEPDHQNLVVVTDVELKAPLFAAVFDKSEVRIESPG